MLKLNGNKIESFLFSGGEIHLSVADYEFGAETKISATLDNSEEIIKLLLLVDAVRRKHPRTNIDLEIPYFPYARQDRVCNPGESLSVKVMADLINGLGCREVMVFDPHSDVTPALLSNCRIRSMAEIISESSLGHFVAENDLLLVAPDAGAEKKVQTVAKRLSAETLSASKKRDTKTGKITSVDVHGVIPGRSYLILDDICDGGQTFIGLAQELRAQGAKEIYLYVTHGIFSKGIDVLKPYFKKVFCLHTLGKFARGDDPFLNILSEEIA
jgi:ribose-phosphate pyrophosphokinase